MSKLFISVEIPEETKVKISEVSSDFKKVVSGNFVKQNNIHLTLKFLGYIDVSKIKEVNEALGSVKFPKFNCELVGVGAFPRESSPRVLWVGVDSGNKELVQLAEDTNKVLAPLGFEKDQRFHPHATFCRVKYVNNKKKLIKLFEKYGKHKFSEFKVKNFSLMESKLGKSGPSYSIIKTY